MSRFIIHLLINSSVMYWSSIISSTTYPQFNVFFSMCCMINVFRKAWRNQQIFISCAKLYHRGDMQHLSGFPIAFNLTHINATHVFIF